MPKVFIYIIKILITLFFVWFFLGKINIAQMFAEVYEANFILFLAALLFSVISWLTNSLRWSEILKLLGFKTSPFVLFLYNSVSNFYGIVLPGGRIVGDSLGTHRLIKEHGNGEYNKHYFLSVYIDRGFGILSIFFVLILYFIFNYKTAEILSDGVFFTGVLIFSVLIFSFLLIFSSFIDDKFLRLTPQIIKKPTQLLFSILKEFRNDKPKLIKAFFLSFISVVFSVLSIFSLSIAVGLDTSFSAVSFSYLLTTVLLVIPITVGGIGLREGGLVYFLVKFGADIHKAAALSIVAFAIIALFSLIGGAVELYNFFIKRRSDTL